MHQKNQPNNLAENLEKEIQVEKTPKSTEKVSKKKLRLIYGHRRRKHNSDSDTNESQSEEENQNDLNENETEKSFQSEDDEGTIVQSSDSGSRSHNRQSNRRRRANLPARRRVNVAKFLERENLSETELNALANSSDSSDSDQNSDSSLNSFKNKKETPKPKEMPQIPSAEVPTNTNFEILNDLEMLQTNYLNPNLAELSLQLFSHFDTQSSLQSPPMNQIQAQTSLVNNSDEFIDNEIYKFILNGKKQVSVPPGFENNPKEVQEIEELGQKIASFQIETDTEVSLFNTDENSSHSAYSDDDDDEDNSQADKQPSKTSNKLYAIF